MANFVSQVKLPNNTTYIIRDPNARTLDNNDFDTINVTELNAGDLIVTGVGRFTNGLYGDLIGNADTASSAIKATQDESGNNIKSTYASAISISDHTITLKNKNGTSLGTVTVPDNNTTYTIATGTANGKIKVTPSSGSAYEVSVYGLKSAAYKDVVDTYSATGTDPVSGKAVAAAIGALPEPMVFKGSLGTGGTVTTLPVDGTAKVGDTYKVITAGTYASKSAKVGDTFICLTKTSSANTWELIPSGDEPSGTVTSVAVTNGGGLSVSGSPITSSGTITISHADTSSQVSVNNSGRTYIQDITLDTYGHVTGITSATETVVNTDRYVNSAAFADATSADANNPVKMTLTRAGSDTASVTAYIPKVSSSSAGVAPKGTAVSSQSQSTKFLREDGTWATPSYTTNTNTTYTLSADTTNNKILLTPSSGTVQSITVPYATNAGSATSATTASKLGSSNVGSATQPIYLSAGTATACTYTLGKSVPSDAVFTDTKNTAGSTDTSSKIFLIGATSQAANPQTYSHDTAYVDTDGCLYSGGTKVLTAHQDISGKADKSATVSNIAWSSNKLTKTINGTTSDVVSAATILGNLTSSQVTTALGYTPASVNTTYDFESPDNSISFNSRAVGSVETVSMTVEGKVSTAGDTISGDYVNTADFSESGITGKRVTTYGPWGIDVEEYVGTSLWSKLSLRDSDILLTKTWDGTNTSLKTSITSLRNDKVNRSGDTMSGQLKGKNPASSWVKARDNACFRNPNFDNNGSYYPVISTKSKSGTWSIGVLSNEEQLRFCWESDSNYNAGTNVSTSVILRATAGTIALTSELTWNSISGKPSTFPPSSHSHSYLPLTGGTVTGGTTFSGTGNGITVNSNILCKSIVKTNFISRQDTGDSGYTNHVNTANSAYTPVRASAFTTMSCKHTKTNIVDISEEDALKLLDIRPVNFDYIEEVGGQKDQIGVLAEDTYEILPKVVSVPDDYVEEDFDISKGIHQPLPSVDYAKFVPYLIKLVQIQERKIEQQNKRIGYLEKNNV